jgi:hypothetical protein
MELALYGQRDEVCEDAGKGGGGGDDDEVLDMHRELELPNRLSQKPTSKRGISRLSASAYMMMVAVVEDSARTCRKGLSLLDNDDFQGFWGVGGRCWCGGGVMVWCSGGARAEKSKFTVVPLGERLRYSE